MALRLDDVDLHRDRALVERFQAGDPGAFDTLYLRYFERLKRFCMKRVGDQYEAEEIAQEAFVRAYRALPNFGGERRFYPWMTVIASRLCVDTHRRRERSSPSAEIDLGVVDGGQEQILDRTDVVQLGMAMERLAPRHREVLEFREQHEWSYQQIADHYGVTVGTVEALLFRARKALKREFSAVTSSARGYIAIPVLGPILRRLASVRARIEGLLPNLSPLAGSAMAVAMAVGTTGAMVAADIPAHAASARAAAIVKTKPVSGVSDPTHAASAAGVGTTTGVGTAHHADAQPTRSAPVAAPPVDAGGFQVVEQGAQGQTAHGPTGLLLSADPVQVGTDVRIATATVEGVNQ